MKTKKEYKNIKIMKLNSPSKRGLIFTEVSLPEQTGINLEFDNKKSIGIATNFRIENDFVICDISLDKKLPDDFNNVCPEVEGLKETNMIKGKLHKVSICKILHEFKECERNLKKTEKEYNQIEDRLEQLTNDLDESIAKEMVKIKKDEQEGLKTLKDLELDFNYFRRDTPPEILEQNIKNLLYEHKRIRNNAIKWIKELNDQDTEEPDEGFGATEYGSRANVIKWIKHFFGITNEDLK